MALPLRSSVRQPLFYKGTPLVPSIALTICKQQSPTLPLPYDVIHPSVHPSAHSPSFLLDPTDSEAVRSSRKNPPSLTFLAPGGHFLGVPLLIGCIDIDLVQPERKRVNNGECLLYI